MIVILLSLILIILMYNYYIRHGRNGCLINRIPGLPFYPIVGTILQYFCSREEYWRLFVNISDEFYPIFKIWSFFTPYISIRHPDDLKTILSNTKNTDKSKVYHIMHPLVGTGLLSGGTKWHLQRKLLTYTLHFNMLHKFVEILIEEGKSISKSLKDIKGTVVTDSLPLVSEHMLNAICETVLGTSLQELGPLQQQYQKAFYEIEELLSYRVMRPWLHNWIFLLTPKGREQTKILKILHGFTERIIAERKLFHELTNDRYLKNFDNDILTESDDTGTIRIQRKRLALLDLLIAASRENHLTDLDIKEIVNTLIYKGHKVVTMGICYLLALLAEHKNIQDRVRYEIDTAMEKNGEKLTTKLLQDLPYLDRCIKEALRLYPGVITARTSVKDIKLRSYLVPAGTLVNLNIYGVHRDPNFWPNPEVFDPDRFLPEKIRNRHPYSYLPFSAGSHNCIGQQFAILEMKAIVAPLLHNFCLEPIDYLKNIRIQIGLLPRPTHPLRIRFVPVGKINASV